MMMMMMMMMQRHKMILESLNISSTKATILLARNVTYVTKKGGTVQMSVHKDRFTSSSRLILIMNVYIMALLDLVM
jgi:hypothetical protein